LGGDIDQLIAGAPIGIDFGPNTALGKSFDKSISSQTTSTKTDALGKDGQQFVLAAQSALRSNTKVNSSGSESLGEHLVITIDLAAAYRRLTPALAAYLKDATNVGAAANYADQVRAMLAKTPKLAPVSPDVWIRSGKIARVEVDIIRIAKSEISAARSPFARLPITATLKLRLYLRYPPAVVVPAGLVIIPPDALSSTSGLFGLGGLGSFGRTSRGLG
jgi:hypothetical protein